jgi:hypothetical protein
MKKINQTIITATLFCIIIILIAFSKEAKQGAIEGINLCENIIIPSLLPILILSNTMVRLKSSTLSAVFFGLISGYPAGAVLTHSLYKEGLIDEKEAEGIMSFNFCGGCAFIISAVGSIVYKNIKAGIVLFACSVLSSLIIALIKRPVGIRKGASHMRFNDALCAGVESSVKSLAAMSAYIILFSSLMDIVKLPDFLIPALEITNGVCKIEKLLPLPFCAFFLSFGGLCVHFQLFTFLRDMKISYFSFIINRILGASLSYFICRIILHFSDDTSLVSANLSPSLPFEISKLGGGLSLVMIIGCAVIIFDLENRKMKLLK